MKAIRTRVQSNSSNGNYAVTLFIHADYVVAYVSPEPKNVNGDHLFFPTFAKAIEWAHYYAVNCF